MMSEQSVDEKLATIVRLLKSQLLQSKKLWDMEDVMFLLGVSRNTLNRMIRQKKIPAYRPVKGTTFFMPKEIKFWIMSHRSVTIWSLEKLDNPDVDTSELE